MDLKRMRSLKKAHRVMREIAREQGISERKVVADIEAAIAEAIKNVYESNNVKAIMEWEKIPCKGDVPTAYELLAYLGEKLISATSHEEQSTNIFS